jgi:rhodanese-related sulfurtransferase
MRTLSPAEVKPLLDAGSVTVLDVRTPEELSLAQLPGTLNIPMNEIPARLSELDPSAPIVVMCHHGMRSAMAGQFLERNGFKSISNLAGGIDAWSLEIDDTVPRY